MAHRYHIGTLATLRNELKQIVKDAQEGKIAMAEAADKILAVREEIERIISDLNDIERE